MLAAPECDPPVPAVTSAPVSPDARHRLARLELARLRPALVRPAPVPEPNPPDPSDRDSPGGGDPSTGAVQLDLDVIRAQIEQAARRGAAPGVSEAELIDQVARSESLLQAVAGLQVDRIRAFARTFADAQVTAQGADLDPRALENGIVAQIASACRISPAAGRRRLRTARTLHAGLDHVRELHTRGELSREKTEAVASATADLDGDERATVDRELSGHDLPKLGLGRLRDLVRKLVATVAPEKFRARAAAAKDERRVTLRPGEDGMCWLTAHLPNEQGAACLAALGAAVNALWTDASAVVTRSRGQTMADTLVERLTGQARAEQVDVEIQALVPVEALLDPTAALPAVIAGLGPVPVERLLTTRAGRLALRRLITREGVVIGGDSRQRGFTGVLAELIRARDGHRCREPYCDAPIRHIDHVERRADSGETSLDNGRGVCEFHNYVREQPRWSVRATPEGIRTTTPTGHTYTSPTPRAA